MRIDLDWLVACPDWKDRLRSAATADPATAFAAFRELANTRMDFVRTGSLDLAVQRYVKQHGPPVDWPVVRLALLGSSTLSHLRAGIRMGALRRGLYVEIQEGAYGMYQQEILDTDSELHRFKPDVVCLAFDAYHLAGGAGASSEDALQQMRGVWNNVKQHLGCTVIQQTVLPVFQPLMGNHEDRLPESPASVVRQLNEAIRREAAEAGVYLLTIDTWAAVSGVTQWHDPALWFRSKQEIHPRASVAYGDQLGRLLAALKGLSAKCLVLDLDNTLWGGVIGDDGLDGIILGQGSTVGEAHVALQRYGLQLSKRGVILAVCSKNDEENAVAPFQRHDDMVLRQKDIACFVANWQDKATNLRHIARTLNIGLDALVFVDDNPAERALIRRELPMVQVPELPEDPAEYVAVLAAAGYFESLNVTTEDRQRATAYRENTERESLRSSTTDLESYLRALRMKLTWQPFTLSGLQRIVQLNNKTNQFNLTTYRYSESDALQRMHDPECLTLQLRLSDVYGDNGVIGLVVARCDGTGSLDIETWLMSCRVLGRKVEEATLTLLVQQAARRGCHRLVGTYRPSGKNGMVRQHYARLGFTQFSEEPDGATRWQLRLSTYLAPATPIEVLEGESCMTRTSIAA